LDNIPRQFIGMNQLYDSLANTVQGIFILFNGNFWGLPIKGNAFYILNGLLAGLVIIAAACNMAGLRRAADDKLPSDDYLYRLVLGSVSLATGAVFFLTIQGSSIYNIRYLILAVSCMTVLGSISLLHYSRQSAMQRSLLVIVALLVVGSLLNLAGSARLLRNGLLATNKPNDSNYKIIATIEQEGLTKGYADYWDGPINTYLSNNRIHVLQTLCSNDQLTKFNWLINKPEFDAPANNGSFYLLNRTPKLSGCDKKQLDLHLLGQPRKVIDIDDRYSLYIYSFDIGQGKPLYTPQGN
jgi:hypothetical protein